MTSRKEELKKEIEKYINKTTYSQYREICIAELKGIEETEKERFQVVKQALDNQRQEFADWLERNYNDLLFGIKARNKIEELRGTK